MKKLDGGNNFYVPNDAEGKEFLRLARKFLHKKKFKMKVRGRHPDRQSIADSLGVHDFQQDMPLKYASYFAVYIDWKVRPQLSRHDRSYQEQLEKVIQMLNDDLKQLRAEMNKPPVKTVVARFGKRKITIAKGESK